MLRIFIMFLVWCDFRIYLLPFIIGWSVVLVLRIMNSGQVHFYVTFIVLILHSFHAPIRLAGMPRRIPITQMNLKRYNALETFGSVNYCNFWSLYLYLIFIVIISQ